MDLIGFVTGVLGWRPSDAWDASPAELWLALDAYLEANMSDEDLKKYDAANIDVEELQQLRRDRELQLAQEAWAKKHAPVVS